MVFCSFQCISLAIFLINIFLTILLFILWQMKLFSNLIFRFFIAIEHILFCPIMNIQFDRNSPDIKNLEGTLRPLGNFL